MITEFCLIQKIALHPQKKNNQSLFYGTPINIACVTILDYYLTEFFNRK